MAPPPVARSGQARGNPTLCSFAVRCQCSVRAAVDTYTHDRFEVFAIDWGMSLDHGAEKGWGEGAEGGRAGRQIGKRYKSVRVGRP